MHCRIRHFTLLELMAVIAILVMLTAVSGVYIGRERKRPAYEQALRDFQVFCARARSESMQDGEYRRIVFYPEENVFRIEKIDRWSESPAYVLAEDAEGGDIPYVVLEAIDPDWEDEQKLSRQDEEEQYEEIDYASRPDLYEWRFPEKLGVEFQLPDFEDELLVDENYELWRYTRGGGARLLHALTVQYKGDIKTITVSDFSGLVEIIDGVPGEEDGME